MKRFHWLTSILTLQWLVLGGLFGQEHVVQFDTFGGRILGGGAFEVGGNLNDWGGRHPGSAAVGKQHDVLRLLLQGERADAVSMAADHLRSLIELYLQPGGRNLIDGSFAPFVRAYGLTDAILEEAAVAPGDPLDARLDFAAMCEMLGEWERARSAYRAVLQTDASQDGARSHLAMLLVRSEPAEAAELVRGTRAEALSGIGQELANLLMMQRQMDDRLNVFEVLVAYVEALEDTEGNIEMEFLPSVFQVIGQGHYQDDVRVTELFTTQNYRYGFDHPEQAERSEMADKRRRELFERFCLAVMKLPAFAAEAFRYHAGVLSRPEGDSANRDDGTQRNESDQRPLEDLALRILLDEPATEVVFQDPNAQHNYNESWVPLLTPHEFLSAAAIARNDFTGITSEILPRLEAAGKTDTTAFLRAMADLHATSPDTFIAKAGAVIEANHPRVQTEQLLRQINDMIDQRGLEVDRGPLILSRLAAMKDTQYMYASYVLSYAQEQARESTDAYRGFLRKVAEIFLGPAEDRKALVETFYQPNHHEPGTPNGAIRAFVQFLSHMMNDIALAAPALALADELGLIHPQDYQMSNQVQNLLRSHRIDDQPEVFFEAFLKESPFLAGPETFRTYRMSNLNRSTVFGFLVEQLASLSGSNRDRIIDPIRDHQPAGMGQQIILAYLDASSSSDSARGRAVAGALEPHIDTIRKLPDERQEEYIWWLQDYFPKGNAVPPLVRNQAAKFTAWLEEWHAKPGALGEEPNQNRRVNPGNRLQEKEADIDRFLQATGRGDFRNTGTTMENDAVLCLLKAASSKDFDTCDKIFAHYDELSAPASGDDPRSTERHLFLFSQFLQQAPGLEAAGLVLKWQRERNDRSFRDHPGVRQGLQTALASFNLENPQAGLEALRAASGGAVPNLLPFWIEPCQRAAGNTETIDRLIRWTETVADDPASATIAEDIRLAARLSALGPDAPEAAKTAVEDACRQRLQDPEASLAWRQFAASQLMSPAMRIASPPLARACLQTMAERAEDEAAEPRRSTFPLAGMLHLFAGAPLPEAMKPVAREYLTLLEENGEGLALPQFPSLAALCANIDYPLQKLVENLPDNLRYQPNFLVTLLQADLVDEAAAAVPWALVSMPPMLQLQDNRRSIRRVVNGNIVVQSQGNAELQPGSMHTTVAFNDGLRNNVAKLLETIDDEGERYALALILEASAASNDEEATAARAERLADMRRRYRLADFHSPDLARHSLGWLLCLDPTEITDAMREGIRRFGPEIDATLFMAWGDPFKAPLDAIVRVHLLDSLLHDPVAFAGILDRQLDALTDQPEQVQQFLAQYCHQFPQGVFDDLKSLDRERAARLLPLFRTLSNLPESIYFQRRSECINGTVVCHILADRPGELEEWFDSLEGRREQVERYVDFDTVINLLATGLADEGMDQARKEVILNGIFTNEILSRRASNGSLFQNLLNRNLISADDLLRHGPEWAALNPRGGAAYNELAGYQIQNGRATEAIDSYLRAMMESSLENSNDYSRAAVGKAELLLNMNRLDSAMTWFAFVQRGRLNSNDQRRFDQLYRDARARFLRDRPHAVSLLTDSRRRLEEKSDDAEAWRGMAEVFASLGQQRIEGGDYLGGSTMLEVAFHIFRALQNAGVPGVEAFYEDSKNALVKAQSAIGMGALAATLVSRQSRWTYHYSEEPVSPSWHAVDFEPRGWRTGRGQLGYGDGDERTRLSFGDDEKNKPITAYFRLAFEVENRELMDTLTLGALHDDGIVVYLNGKELVRHNMPPGPVTQETLASDSRGSDQENAYWEYTFSADLLHPGANVLAAEVHQNQSDSSDLGFDIFLQSEAINVQKIVARLESGKGLDRLGEWKAYLPDDYAVRLKALRRFP